MHRIDFRSLVEHSRDAMAVFDGYQAIYANKAMLSLIKVPSLEKMDKNFMTYLHPDYHEVCARRIHDLLERNRPAEEMEQKLIASDGEVIDVEVSAAPLIQQGKTFIQANYQDIRVKKQAEIMVDHSERLSTIGKMSAGIAHEIRNPLTAVRGFLQLLNERQPHVYLDISLQELDRAVSTLNNLLQVAKPDREEPLVMVDLHKELESLILLFQQQMYHVNVLQRYWSEAIHVRVKRNSFNQALFNLLKNAFEAIEDKGTIRIETFLLQDKVQIKLSDSGKGIDKDKLPLLGTPFFSTKSEGTGMGLTQVFSTIQDHKGTIHVESKVNVGTTFHIFLPL